MSPSEEENLEFLFFSLFLFIYLPPAFFSDCGCDLMLHAMDVGIIARACELLTSMIKVTDSQSSGKMIKFWIVLSFFNALHSYTSWMSELSLFASHQIDN